MQAVLNRFEPKVDVTPVEGGNIVRATKGPMVLSVVFVKNGENLDVEIARATAKANGRARTAADSVQETVGKRSGKSRNVVSGTSSAEGHGIKNGAKATGTSRQSKSNGRKSAARSTGKVRANYDSSLLGSESGVGYESELAIRQQRYVCQYLERVGCASSVELMHRLGLSPERLGQHVESLRNKNLIAVVGKNPAVYKWIGSVTERRAA